MLRRLLCLLALIFPLQVLAAVGSWQEDGPVKVRLISPVNNLAGKSDVLLGLHIKLQPGWKTYWRTPGAAGAPPSLTLDHAALVPEPEWFWPAPKRFSLLGLQSYGYSDEVIIPVRYKLNSSRKLIQLRGQIQVYVCNEICLPLQVPVSLNLSGEQERDWLSQRLINEFMAQVPTSLEKVQSSHHMLADEAGLYLSLGLPSVSDNVDLFIENYDLHEWPDPVIKVQDTKVQVWWNVPEGTVADFPDQPLKITYVDGIQAYEGTIQVENIIRPEQGNASGSLKWVSILLMALAGGLILNVMPCVLPILSIKLMHLSEASMTPKKEARIQLLLTALGVLSFFWILALSLGGLKLAGYYVGWGIQFQNPFFLIFMLLIMLLFAANMLGWFEFTLPARWQTAMVSAGSESHHSARIASFIQGMGATLLATPCSAPFLGTAVAFALSQGVFEIFWVFSALGVGLAAPYIVLSIWPGLITRLPKPGRWMKGIRRILALGLLLAAAWLIWLLSNHLNNLMLFSVTLLGAVWFMLWGPELTRWRPVTLWLALVLLIMPFFGSEATSLKPYPQAFFQPERISEMVNEGKVILVDITADWCITCKYNKAAVLDAKKGLELLDKYDVTFMQGDWSLPSESIETFLNEHGRSGIPFNVVYGPNAPEGLLLPELLTIEGLRIAVRSAAGNDFSN